MTPVVVAGVPGIPRGLGAGTSSVAWFGGDWNSYCDRWIYLVI